MAKAKKEAAKKTETKPEAEPQKETVKQVDAQPAVESKPKDDGKLKPAAIPVESFQKARASKSVSVDGRITLENKNGHKTSYTEAQAEYFLSKYPERYKIV